MKNEKTEGAFIEIETSKLVKAAWNYKKEDADLQAKLTRNIKRNGQIESVVIREIAGGRFEIVNGNHRLASFKEAGIDRVMAFNLGNVSILEAKRIAIILNETRFESDNLKLSRIFNELNKKIEIPDMIKEMPYNQQQLKAIMEMDDFDLEGAMQERTAKTKKRSSAPCIEYRIEIPMKFKSVSKAIDSFLSKYADRINIRKAE